ncbi:hypothetical protein TNCV_2034381 [Trichonephila clavipes]|nr:hypothetical protein TNCV_2034381 [Trichonephila clavipes]
MSTQRSRSFAWESIQDRTIRRLCSKASQPSTSLYTANKEVTSTALTPISGIKFLRMRDDEDQWPNSNRGYVQTKVILRHLHEGFWRQPRNFEPWSSEVDDTRAGTRTHDIPEMIRYLDHWATAAQ